MKTIKQLKEKINYRQTDEVFLSFLALLERQGVITIVNGDIDAGMVSDSLFIRLTAAYGIHEIELNNQKEDN